MAVFNNYVQVVGTIWMPSGTTAGMEYPINQYALCNLEEIANIRHKQEEKDGTLHADSEGITREDVAEWLNSNSGDFQKITDFCASIEGIDIGWEDTENAFAYFVLFCSP